MLRARRHYDRDAFERILRADPGELDVTLDGRALDGAFPDELVGGTVWLNGPGALDRGGWLLHPFDGHGYLRALRLRRGGVRLQARFVRTPAWEAESRSGRMIHRGLGTIVPGGPLANLRAPQRRHVANTAVVPWSDRVLALWEGGLPFAVDPETLATRGPETFAGALSESAAFLAHTRFDARANRLVGVTQEMAGLKTRYEILEIGADARVLSRRKVTIDRISVTHDFVITPRYYILLENAVTLDPLGFVRARLGLGPLLGALRQRAVPGRVLLVPRDGGPARGVKLDRPLFTIHHVNAWDDGDGVEILTCAFSRMRFGSEFGYRGPKRKIDPGLRGPEGAERMLRIAIRGGHASVGEVSPYAIDFPRAHPHGDGQPTRHAWGATNARVGHPDPFDAVAHVDLERGRTAIWRAGDGRFAGEPLVVPKSGARTQQDAWILVFVYDGRAAETRLVLLDGADLAAGPRASARLPALMPYGFHGYFDPPRA